MVTQIMKEDFEEILADKTIDWKQFAGNTILITGANGFLVSYMLLTLLTLNNKKKQEPCIVIGLVRNLKKAEKKFCQYLNDPHLILVEHDIATPYKTQMKIDYIIHAASYASPKYFFSDPVGIIKANALGTHYMLEIGKEKEVKSFLFFSSGEVAGDIFEKLQVPTEDDYGYLNLLHIRNCYAESKRMGENMCACWFYQYGVPAKIVRPSHTYGPGFDLNDGRAFTYFIKSVLEDKNISLKSDGCAMRSFCYITDATRAYFKVLLKGENGQSYNVSNEYEIFILDLANIVINVSKNKHLKVCVKNDQSTNSSSQISHGLMSIDKIKTLNWLPLIKEQIGFKRTLNSFMEQENESTTSKNR